jgi:hypothetical protein
MVEHQLQGRDVSNEASGVMQKVPRMNLSLPITSPSLRDTSPIGYGQLFPNPIS